MSKPALAPAQGSTTSKAARTKPTRPASLRRHVRKCSVCHHQDREFIEQDYLRWVSPKTISRDYGIAHHSSVYRHAQATGLVARRQAGIRATLENFLERSESVRVTADSIIAAVRIYSHLDDNGQWIPTRKPSARCLAADRISNREHLELDHDPTH